MQLFGERGIASVTIKDIAQAANCAEGALYRHYESKEKLAHSLFTREISRFGERIRKVLQDSKDFHWRARETVRMFYSFLQEAPVTFRFILLTQHDFPGMTPVPPEQNPNDLVIAFVREGIDSGEFTINDAALGASLVLGMVLQPAMMHLYGRLKGSMENWIEPVTEACWKVLAE